MFLLNLITSIYDRIYLKEKKIQLNFAFEKQSKGFLHRLQSECNKSQMF